MKDESHGISALVLNMDFSFDNASINTKYLHCNLRSVSENFDLGF